MGAQNKLVEGEILYYKRNLQHFWIELSDGRIVDPTADQFNDEGYEMPQIYLGIKPRRYERHSKKLTRLRKG